MNRKERPPIKGYILLGVIILILLFASSVVAFYYTVSHNISVSLRVVGREESSIFIWVMVLVGIVTVMLVLGIYGIHKLKRG
jgi:choline-glycine betaine transporter